MNVCIHCKWCEVVEDVFGGANCEYNCTHDNATNLVTGEPTDCEDQRYSQDLDHCGRNGDWFEPSE